MEATNHAHQKLLVLRLNGVTLAHIILPERLHIFGLGCVLCVVGSTTIVLHAPQEHEIESVKEVWDLATEPAFLFYASLVMAIVLVLVFHYIPEYGQTHIMSYIGVCSLVGSLLVMSVKALGIALKLTLSGMIQLIYLNYLNKLPCIIWLIVKKPRRFSLSWFVNWFCIIFGAILTIVAPVGGLRQIIVMAKTCILVSPVYKKGVLTGRN